LNDELYEIVEQVFLEGYPKNHYPRFSDDRMKEHLGRKVIIDGFTAGEKARFDKWARDGVKNKQQNQRVQD
jgi:hypothetical protein